MGNLWLTALPVAWYFLSETACKLGNLHRVKNGSRKLFTRSRVHICSMLTKREREVRKRENLISLEFSFWTCFISGSMDGEESVFLVILSDWNFY